MGMRPNHFRLPIVMAAFLLSAMPLAAEQPATHDLTPQFATAGLAVDGFRAVEVGGIIVLRGKTIDKSTAEQASVIALSLGYARVANLIQVVGLPDDARIERAAERQLSVYRGLDGTQIAVDSNNGIVRLTGKVYSELQKDMAVSVVRNIDGVRSVESQLQR